MPPTSACAEADASDTGAPLGLRGLARLLGALPDTQDDPGRAVLLVAAAAAAAVLGDDAGPEALRTAFPGAAARATVLRRRLARTAAGPQVLHDVDRSASALRPEELGALYQALRRPRVRRANAEALAGGAKLEGEELLAVTQFLTDDHLAAWLTARTLEGAPAAGLALVVLDPAVGGGALLLAAYRALIDDPDWDVPPAERSELLLGSVLRGYDLDPVLAELAAVALWLEALRRTGQARRPRWVRSGGHEVAGALDPATLRRVLPRGEARRLVVLTNPPFLGRRLMGLPLREHLRDAFPDAGNDLCAAFVGHLAGLLGPGDRLGVVHQTTLRHLGTLGGLRRRVLSSCRVLDAVELGAGAFRDLTGDKARTGLTVLEGWADPEVPRNGSWPEPRLDLSTLDRAAKQAALEHDLALPADGRRPAPPRAAPLRALADAFPPYRGLARPLQGSSTGDNQRFVRYAWEVPAGEDDWREASKGGGQVRWWGLRRHVVRWGEGGVLLASHPGAALRSPALADRAHLVWSDTGTAGLSVRVHAPGSVFMAAGPGILVEQGNPLAHAALLNSRLVSACLRSTNPKLTLTPGVLGALPVPPEAVHDEVLAELGERCVVLKQRHEARRPDCLDWSGPPAVRGELLSWADGAWRAELEDERERLHLEAEVDERVLALLGEGPGLREACTALVGPSPARLPAVALLDRPEGLDARYARRLTPGLRYTGGLRTALACDGPLEALSVELDLAPDVVAHRLLTLGAPGATALRHVEAALHEHCLQVLGFCADRTWVSRRTTVRALAAEVADAVGTGTVPLIDVPLAQWVRTRLPGLHATAFRRRPVLQLDGDTVALRRVAR